MQINPIKHEPATLNLSEINEAASAEIEKKHKKTITKLRKEHAGWLDRQRATSAIELERIELDFMNKWERGEVPADEITKFPSPADMSTRLMLAGRRIESFGEYLENKAAPIVADILDLVADKIEAAILPGATALDAQARAYGESGVVANRVRVNVAKMRDEAARYRSGNSFMALARLEDYLPLDA